MAKTTKTAIAPAMPALHLNKAAESIVRAAKAFDEAGSKFSAAVCTAMQSMVDAAYAAGIPKTEAGVKHLQAAIRKAEAFEMAVAIGVMERKTITEYAQGAARAFFHGVDFTPSLKNNPDMALPWGGSKGSTSAKAGKVESTDRAALDATISKALKQARLLGLTGFAADVLDLALAALDGFEEKAE